LDDVLVLVGGNIPRGDIQKLEALGVDRVFRTGSHFDDMVSFIEESVGE
jgi:methylmalonyl-CoA mutase cobalamin-binding domain/chain